MVERAKSNLKEWRSTTFAICAALVAIGSAAMALLDDDPATVPDWTATISAVSAAVALCFARWGE